MMLPTCADVGRFFSKAFQIARLLADGCFQRHLRPIFSGSRRISPVISSLPSFPPFTCYPGAGKRKRAGLFGPTPLSSKGWKEEGVLDFHRFDYVLGKSCFLKLHNPIPTPNIWFPHQLTQHSYDKFQLILGKHYQCFSLILASKNEQLFHHLVARSHLHSSKYNHSAPNNRLFYFSILHSEKQFRIYL